MKIKKETLESGYQQVVIRHDNGAINVSSEVDSFILFAILEKLEEIHCGIIDVENAVENLTPIENG